MLFHGCTVFYFTWNPRKICCDNSVVVTYSKMKKRSGGLKHVEIMYSVVKDKIKERYTVIEHISMEVMYITWMLKLMRQVVKPS